MSTKQAELRLDVWRKVCLLTLYCRVALDIDTVGRWSCHYTVAAESSSQSILNLRRTSLYCLEDACWELKEGRRSRDEKAHEAEFICV